LLFCLFLKRYYTQVLSSVWLQKFDIAFYKKINSFIVISITETQTVEYITRMQQLNKLSEFVSFWINCEQKYIFFFFFKLLVEQKFIRIIAQQIRKYFKNTVFLEKKITTHFVFKFKLFKIIKSYKHLCLIYLH
jgi:hypothetical protein